MIPLFKVYMSADAKNKVATVLDSGYIGQGDKVEEFEQELGNFLESYEPPLSISSGTASLDLALHLIGVGQGDEVISTPITCTATNGVIYNRGAKIIWADVDPLTGNINPQDVANKITKKTKAIMAVDWGGRPCEYADLKKFGIPVIEDAAHAFDAKYNGQPIAKSGGDYICWSFQAIKHLTTIDGGAILPPTNQIERARLLRWFGLDRRSSSSFRCEQTITEIGYKYHMNDVSAAVGLCNLQDMSDVLTSHRFNALAYDIAFSSLQNIKKPPKYEYDYSWWLYTILVPDQKKFMKYMRNHGIDTSPVHARNDKHPQLNNGIKFGDLPGVDYFADHEVAIPVGWWLTDQDLYKIVDCVIQWDKIC